MNQKPLLIAHAEDPDGIISRTLKMRHFSMSGKSPEDHVFVRYDRIVKAFEQGVQLAGQHDSVYISDVSLNSQLIKAGGDDFALLEKLVAGKESFWFDHHQGTFSHEKKLAEMGINVIYNPSLCGAFLVAQHFSLQDHYGKKLAKIAQAHDYKNTPSDAENIQIGNELEKIIAIANVSLNYDLLLDLSCDLRDETCFDSQFKLLAKWQNYVEQFNQQEPQAHHELDDNVEILKVGEYNILFGYSSSLLSAKPGPFYLRQKYRLQADIFVCLFKSPTRNHLVLTNQGVQFPVVPFVQRLGGDGRGNGGGFSLDYDITPANYQQVKEMLLSQIERYV